MNCDCNQKMSGDRGQENQDEEDQRETSKLIAYLSIKSENCKNEKMQCSVKQSNRCIQNVHHLQP